MGLGFTILLGMAFTTFQAIEYSDAPFKFDGGGVYPSAFFLATGFHGFHVIVGTCFLIVCWFRARGGEFTPQRHFGFEAAAWYWHFVDVVWLFLFVASICGGAGSAVGRSSATASARRARRLLMAGADDRGAACWRSRCRLWASGRCSGWHWKTALARRDRPGRGRRRRSRSPPTRRRSPRSR